MLLAGKSKNSRSKSRKPRSRKPRSRGRSKAGRKPAARKSKSYSRPKSRKPASKPTGCTKQTTARYSKRPGPPYPGNQCCWSRHIGNDGLPYISVPDKNGICSWKKA